MKKLLFGLVTMLYFVLAANAQDSLNVRRLGFYNTVSDNSYAVAVTGSYAYIADGSWGYQVVNVSNPESPEGIVFHRTGHGMAFDVDIQGNYACITESTGIWIVDISNPAAPIDMGYVALSGYSRNSALEGNYAYVATDEGGLRIVDISNPHSPVEVGSYISPGHAYDVSVMGNYAYIGDGDSGLRVVDISNPTLPVETGFVDSLGSWGVAVKDNYAYVAGDLHSLQIVDVSNPEDPRLCGTFDIPGQISNLVLAGNYAYLTSKSSGLRVVDISNPGSPFEVGFYSPYGTGNDLAVSGGLTYVADGWGLSIYDCRSALRMRDHSILSPSTFSLSCYPNPFNPSTQISFHLPQVSDVKLAVYDVMGRLVKSALPGGATGRIYSAGEHHVTFDGSGLPSGVYVCRMEANGFVDQKKMMLIK